MSDDADDLVTEEDEGESSESEDRKERTGVDAKRWCDVANTPEPTDHPDGTPGDLENEVLVRLLCGTVDEIEGTAHQEGRRARMLRDLGLIAGEDFKSLDDATNVLVASADDDNGQVFNAAYGVLSTIENRIMSFRARAQFLPAGGNGKARRAARNMTALSDAWAAEVDYQAEATAAFADELACDIGVMMLYIEDGTTKISRFPPWQFLVERRDGADMMPECFYHVRRIAATQAAAALGVDITKLISKDGFEMEGGAAGTSLQEAASVRIINAWQAASGVQGTDSYRPGRHVIVVGRILCEDEDWAYDSAPWVVGRFERSKTGWEGRSAMSFIRGAQIELNEITKAEKEQHYKSAGKTIQYEEGAISPDVLDNAFVSAIPRAIGTKPAEITVHPPMHPGELTYEQRVEDRMYKTLGVSQNAAQGQGRAGVTAAVAIREDTEIQSDRLANKSTENGTKRVLAATWWWRLTRDYARKHPEAKPKWKSVTRGAWKTMIFGDLEGEYQIQTLPSSLFGQSLAGRFQRANDLIKEGWIEREDAMKLLDVPDVSPVVDLAMADRYLMEQIVDDILEIEKYTTPDEYLIAGDGKAKFFNYAKRRYFLALVDNGESESDDEKDWAWSENALKEMRRLLNFLKPPGIEASAVPPGVDTAPLPPPGAPPVPIQPPPVLPGIAPPTAAGPTPMGEPPVAPTALDIPKPPVPVPPLQ